MPQVPLLEPGKLPRPNTAELNTKSSQNPAASVRVFDIGSSSQPPAVNLESTMPPLIMRRQSGERIFNQSHPLRVVIPSSLTRVKRVTDGMTPVTVIDYIELLLCHPEERSVERSAVAFRNRPLAYRTILQVVTI